MKQGTQLITVLKAQNRGFGDINYMIFIFGIVSGNQLAIFF